MPKVFNINGKDYRYYRLGGVYVADDGFAAYKNGTTAGTWKRLFVKTEANGEKNIIDGRYKISSMAVAVITCFCPPKPKDGKTYVIEHIDGNLSNCTKSNLRWSLKHYVHTSADSIKLKCDKFTITVKKDGSIWIKGQQEKIYDSLYNSDIDLFDCIAPHIHLGPLFGTRYYIDDIMKNAGYVQGDDAVLTHPVILHKDNDVMNFASDNLEWVESNDQRYIDYKAKEKEYKKKRREEMNPGKQLYPDW